nr:unnamed protein product [Digitaria exilis]
MSSSSNGGKKPAAGGGRGGPTIRTLADIGRGPTGFPGAGGSGSDSDEPQEYYTGGEKSVDDGPLRAYDDPENADFIESLRMSQCPRELEPADRSTPVHVNVVKRLEDYQEPIRPRSAFQGVGRTLGGGPSADDSSAPAPAAPTSAPPASRSSSFIVDDSQPFTSIQLRLADGTRMVARFNMHHTVADIRSFIDASRPGASRPYQLQTGFPPKQLTDPTQTVEHAGLANSVIMQKM